MCYTRASNYYQNTGLTEPDHEEHFTDFDRLLCRLTIANCATLARRDLIARYYAEVRPGEHPEWLTDDAPMWLWFAALQPDPLPSGHHGGAPPPAAEREP